VTRNTLPEDALLGADQKRLFYIPVSLPNGVVLSHWRELEMKLTSTCSRGSAPTGVLQQADTGEVSRVTTTITLFTTSSKRSTYCRRYTAAQRGTSTALSSSGSAGLEVELRGELGSTPRWDCGLKSVAIFR
jgi:hypothetical protein